MACPQIVVNCPEDCPARHLRRARNYGPFQDMPWDDWVRCCEYLRRRECNEILRRHGRIRAYILTESIPRTRFVYDEQSNYCIRSARRGLRTRLCKELINAECPPDVCNCSQCLNLNTLLNYLRDKGILILDCALCPLHRLRSRRARRHAATLCLNNNTIAYLNVTQDSPIITIFPANADFLEVSSLLYGRRVEGRFNFSSLGGLRDKIQEILESDP